MSRTLVLLIEDEPAIAETVLYALESAGFEPIHAGTGEAGLALFRERDPAIIILDVGLPDLTGFEVCREIRRGSEVPVLFLTARDGEIDRVVGLELGADDYVVKPFSPRELTARVGAILRRSKRSVAAEDTMAAAPPEVMRKGRLELLTDRYQARLDGADLGLSRYEFGMLKVFLSHPGRVYSRDQLMDLVWDEPEAALDRTVDAHIKTLRKKMHAIDPAYDPVKTHRGLGYSFDEHP
ncbi:MAG: two-component system response regulator CreB [Verrucomicrobiales bacterium]|nr:two-component system response regulator CreB [Verrucomicrobiales bacterium]